MLQQPLSIVVSYLETFNKFSAVYSFSTYKLSSLATGIIIV